MCKSSPFIRRLSINRYPICQGVLSIMTTVNPQAAGFSLDWGGNSRWRGVTRPYTAADVLRLRGSVHIEHTLARLGAEKFWGMLHSEPVIGALGCMSGNQAVRAVRAGRSAVSCSGREWGG